MRARRQSAFCRVGIGPGRQRPKSLVFVGCDATMVGGPNIDVEKDEALLRVGKR